MPGAALAFSKSIFVIFAAAHFERKIAPQSQPCGCTSYAYFAAPVTFAGPSTRGIGLPTYFLSLGQSDIFVKANDFRFFRRLHARGLQRGGEHARIRAAAAEVSRAGAADIFLA